MYFFEKYSGRQIVSQMVRSLIPQYVDEKGAILPGMMHWMIQVFEESVLIKTLTRVRSKSSIPAPSFC